MARERFFLFALNGGMVSPLALARTDLQRMKLTAQVFENCWPRVIGPIQIRGGLEYLGSTKGDGKARQIPFIFSVEDTAKIELSNLGARVLVNEVEVTRPAVSTVITNGDFSSASGWTLATTGGGVANINSTVAGALVLQTPVRGGSASCSRSISVSGADQGIEHAVKIVVLQGSVRFRLGTTSGGQETLAESEYGVGTHSLSFNVNVGVIYAQLSAKSESLVVVDSITIESSGIMELATKWTDDDLLSIRYDQSGDVIFVADGTHQPQRIVRRGTANSWGVEDYNFGNGPWRGKTANVSLTPSARLGNGTLSASAPFFEPAMVGALFELTHTQSVCDVSLAGNDVYTDSVRIAGKEEGTTRNMTWSSTGTYVGKYTLQVSYDDEETWQNYADYTGNTGATVNLGTDGSVVHARFGFQAGDYTSGTLNIAMSTPGGGGTGVVRLTKYTSATSADYEVVKRLHFTGATENWREGKYSNFRGWPTSVSLFEGRLWWGGRDQIAGSYSDEFTNFDLGEEGDAAPIIRSIATGPVNKVQWMLGLSRLVIGTSGAESVARSSSFDEPMTATNFSIKDASTLGSADIQALKVDRSGVFVQRSRNRAYMLSYSVEANDYISKEITRYNPTILAPKVTIMAVQRQPDTRIWYVLEDGTAAVLVYEPDEDVLSWCLFSTDGVIEDITTLPNVESDDVFMVVRRTINGVTKRYRERVAYDSEARGGELNYIADSYKVFDLVASNSVTGLGHLEGKQVVVWADGSPLLDEDGDPQLFTVASAAITLPSEVTGKVIVGLYYEGLWQSTKLAYAAQTGTAMSQKKAILAVAPILYSTHNKAVLFGQDFVNMDPLPQMIEGEDIGINAMLDDYDYDEFALPGHWSNDSRLCLKMRAPMPAVILGVGIKMESHENA